MDDGSKGADRKIWTRRETLDTFSSRGSSSSTDSFPFDDIIPFEKVEEARKSGIKEIGNRDLGQKQRYIKDARIYLARKTKENTVPRRFRLVLRYARNNNGSPAPLSLSSRSD